MESTPANKTFEPGFCDLRKVNILMLGGAKRVSMGRMLIEAGRRMGLDVCLFSYELQKMVPVAEIGTVVEGKKWKDPALFEHLESTIKDYGINILLPFVDPAVEIAIRFCEEHPQVWTPGSNAEMTGKMFDKVKSDSVFRSLGAKVPLSPARDGYVGEVIAKPRCGSASQGILYLGYEEYKKLAETAEASEYLFQQYISPRTEYTVDCYVARNGEVICAVPRVRLETQGGEASVTQTVENREIEESAARLLNGLKMTGPITIQYLQKKDGCGPMMVMEINPRLGGGAVCSVHAGANLPEYILKDYLGQTPGKAVWRPGVRICRYMQEVVFDGLTGFPLYQ